MLNRLLLLLVAGLFILAGNPNVARAQLTFYGARSDFNTAFPGLPVEDFEEARITGPLTVIANPLDTTTNNAVFHTGEILDGLRISSNNNHAGQDIGLVAAGIFGNPSISAYNNFGGDSLDLTFYNNTVQFVGLDVLDPAVSGNPINVSIFGAGNVLLGTTTVTDSAAGSFFGVGSANVITRINFISTSPVGFLRFVGVDNVAFGPGGVAAVPEPNGAVMLLGLGGGGLLLIRGRIRR